MASQDFAGNTKRASMVTGSGDFGGFGPEGAAFSPNNNPSSRR